MLRNLPDNWYDKTVAHQMICIVVFRREPVGVPDTHQLGCFSRGEKAGADILSFHHENDLSARSPNGCPETTGDIEAYLGALYAGPVELPCPLVDRPDHPPLRFLDEPDL